MSTYFQVIDNIPNYVSFLLNALSVSTRWKLVYDFSSMTPSLIFEIIYTDMLTFFHSLIRLNNLLMLYYYFNVLLDSVYYYFHIHNHEIRLAST